MPPASRPHTEHAPADVGVADPADARFDLDIDADTERALVFVSRSAAERCACPMALVAILADQRERLVACVGIDSAELPLHKSLGVLVAGEASILLVTDALEDARMRDNPLVTGDTGARFIAAMPIEIDPGVCVGALCVMATEPRTLTAGQAAALHDLAAHASEVLRLCVRSSRAQRETRQLRRVLDAVPSHIYLKDDRNTILDLNLAAARSMHAEVDEVRGRPAESFFPEQEAADALRADRAVLDAHQPTLGTVEHHDDAHDGHRVYRTDRLPLEERPGARTLVSVSQDITDLERARFALQLHKDALDKAAIVAITDASGVITHANDVFCQISGYTREELIGKTHRIVNSGHHDKSFFIELWRTIASGKTWRGRVCNRAKNGELYWVDTAIVPFVDERGKVEQYVSIRHDITAAVKREREFQELSALQRAVLDAPAYLIISTDHAGVVTSFNAAAERALGYDASEVIGRTTPLLWHDAEEAADRAEDLSSELGIPVEPGFDAFVAKTRHTGHPDEAEWTFTRKDGTRFPALLSTSCLRDDAGEVVGYVGIIRDITDIKLAQEEIAQVHQRLKLAVEGANDGIWDWPDVNADAAWWSPQFFRLLGYEPGEIESSQRVFMGLLHPDHHEPWTTAVGEALAGGDPFDLEYQLKTKPGEYRWFRGRAKVFPGDDGDAARMAGSIQDIEVRKQIQSELEHKNREMEQFVYTASHDLKSPIVTISGYLSLMRADAEKGELAEFPEYFGRLDRAIARMRTNVEDLLELSRVSSVAPESRTLRVSSAVQEVLAVFEQEIQTRNIGFVTEFQHDSVSCDPRHLEQVLSNLIGNAIKHACEEADPQITVRCALIDTETVELAVDDSGPGVPEQHAETIFGVFQQLSRRDDSTGIGLAIVKRVAEVYGGKAWVERAPKGGASFRVRLPAGAPTDTAGPPAKEVTPDDRAAHDTPPDSVPPR